MNEALAAMVRAMADPSKAADLGHLAGGGRATADPRMAVLLELLRDAVSDPEQCAGPPGAEAIGRVVLAERDELRRRVALLAAALGACDRCWGEDASCPACDGAGRPGSSPPHASLFDRYARPAALSLQYLKPDPPSAPQSKGELT